MTRALRRLSRATRDLAEGSFTEPLPTDRKDEIGDLARAFNRMAVRLKEVDTLKEEFFSHISHDLRNPLTGMLRARRSSSAGPGPAPSQARQVKMVRVIDESAERMLAMVNQILEFTRLRAHLMPLERQPVDLAKVVARALDELHPQAEDAGIALTTTTSGADFSVLGDEAALMRVVVNLVGNAVKFTPRGGSILAQVRDWGAEVELRVTDTGVGIAAAELPRIFDPYRQAHTGRKGSGLGLAVVKGLVETHGGRVTVESDPDKGSCFAVTLPRAGSSVVSRPRVIVLVAAVALLGRGCATGEWKWPLLSWPGRTFARPPRRPRWRGRRPRRREGPSNRVADPVQLRDPRERVRARRDAAGGPRPLRAGDSRLSRASGARGRALRPGAAPGRRRRARSGTTAWPISPSGGCSRSTRAAAGRARRGSGGGFSASSWRATTKPSGSAFSSRSSAASRWTWTSRADGTRPRAVPAAGT